MGFQAINDLRFKRLALLVENRGGRLYVIGGQARDTLMEEKLGKAPPSMHSGLGDKDLVCFGLDISALKEAFSILGPTWIVDHRVLLDRLKKDPVLVKVRLGESEFTVAISRKRFQDQIVSEPGASLAEDAACRDFTVNAVYYDPLLEVFFDPLNSDKDFRARRLELCSPTALIEDPARILRAMSFLSRLSFIPGQKLLAATARDWPLLALLPPDRLWPEWRKWALSLWPRLGLEYLRQSGALAFWPDLQALIDSPQLFKFHPEGDVWNHTLLVVGAMAELNIPVSLGRVFLTLTSLLHDIGKPKVTFIATDGRVMTRGHAPAGLPLAKKFLASIKSPAHVAKAVLRLIERHMDLSFREPTTLNLKILARRLWPFCDLGHFWAITKADWQGRIPYPFDYPWTLEEFLEPVDGQRGPSPIPLEARELMAELDLPGGPMVGKLMALITEAFDKGEIFTGPEALKLAAAALAKPEFKAANS
ncbi:MAG: HD domain-containing protein [Deltaproteobacteria bacterium]|jgi:tRNA nucleotidyltransferase (CCA-adding enzyme)|nr:HD domain-containing protein [Deltaproteobacteria bacterium]